jgi:hypothetical protein
LKEYKDEEYNYIGYMVDGDERVENIQEIEAVFTQNQSEIEVEEIMEDTEENECTQKVETVSNEHGDQSQARDLSKVSDFRIIDVVLDNTSFEKNEENNRSTEVREVIPKEVATSKNRCKKWVNRE